MNHRITFDQACTNWVGGGTFETFMRETSAYARSYAERSARRMRLPECVQIGDIVQEFYLRAWQAGTNFDASRGTSPGKYILMGAYRNANVWLHKQRGALARDVRSPSRHALAFSSLPSSCSDEDEPGSVEEILGMVSDTPDAEALVAARERVEQLLQGLCSAEADLLLAFIARGGHPVGDDKSRRKLRRVLSNLIGGEANG